MNPSISINSSDRLNSSLDTLGRNDCKRNLNKIKGTPCGKTRTGVPYSFNVSSIRPAGRLKNCLLSLDIEQVAFLQVDDKTNFRPDLGSIVVWYPDDKTVRSHRQIQEYF